MAMDAVIVMAGVATLMVATPAAILIAAHAYRAWAAIKADREKAAKTKAEERIRFHYEK